MAKTKKHTAKQKKLTDKKLLELKEQGLSDAEIARRYGYSRPGLYMRRKRLNIKTSSVITQDKAREIVEYKLDAMSQLRKIQHNANELLDLCMDWIRGEDVAIQALEHKIRKVRVGDKEFEDKIDIKDPHDIAMRAMNEIRAQIHAQVEIAKVLYDAKAVQYFQDVVLGVIGQIDPDARQRIISELNRRRLSIQSPVSDGPRSGSGEGQSKG